MKKHFINGGILLLSAGILYYFMLPAINIHDTMFWAWIIILLVEFLFLTSMNVVGEHLHQFKMRKGKYVAPATQNFGKTAKVTIGTIGLIFLYIIGSSIIFSPLFVSGKYANRIELKEVSFEEIPPYSFNKTAIIDRASAENLGNKVMGEMTDLVSQFVVSSEYSQISYQEGTYRVTPLGYDGFIKYFKNRKEGIPGYIIVNTTTGQTELVRLDEKMRYVPSAYFNENLMRKLRFLHPTEIFGNPTFEIDEEGNPYYVCTTFTYHGVGMLEKVTGAILFDPIHGTSKKYSIEEVPEWVDRIYPEKLITEELNDYGLYQNGFLNSFIGQEGVIQTSEGYNYISKDGDIWLYTGVTSVVADESNIGFALVNLRTHEAQKITTSGADEYSIMASAEGEVLNYGYTATFPVLVNIDNKPIYLLSLKDSAGLVKMYAMVDARDYQQVYTIKADKDAKSAIEDLILQISSDPSVIYGELKETTITVDAIEKIFQNGNTVYYILSGEDIYKVPFKEEFASKILFLKGGESLHIFYQESESEKIIQTIE